MRSHLTRLATATFLCAGIVSAWIIPALAATAPPGNPTPTHPPIPTQLADLCKDHLTRTPDLIITMGTSLTTINKTVTTVPVATGPVGAANAPCKRRVIEIRVPAPPPITNPPTPCPNCAVAAEIHVCAGTFSGGVKGFEDFCTTPFANTVEATCKTFQHPVEVYKQAAGQTDFVAGKPKYLYQGFVSQAQCRVAASTYGATHNHDTAEVQPNVTRPASGVDVYRVLSNPVFNGNSVPTVLFMTFE